MYNNIIIILLFAYISLFYIHVIAFSAGFVFLRGSGRWLRKWLTLPQFQHLLIVSLRLSLARFGIGGLTANPSVSLLVGKRIWAMASSVPLPMWIAVTSPSSSMARTRLLGCWPLLIMINLLPVLTAASIVSGPIARRSRCNWALPNVAWKASNRILRWCGSFIYIWIGDNHQPLHLIGALG